MDSRNMNVDICCFCGCGEDIVSIEEIKKGLELTSGKVPLPLCYYCLELEIVPPTSNTSTKFIEKEQQDKASMKRRLDSLISNGYNTGRK